MRDLLLPLSLLALAGAVALHAISPAIADDTPPGVVPAPAPPPPPEPVVVAAPVSAAPYRVAPECRPVRVGTPKEYEKLLGELHDAGANDFLVIGTGVVCGWR